MSFVWYVGSMGFSSHAAGLRPPASGGGPAGGVAAVDEPPAGAGAEVDSPPPGLGLGDRPPRAAQQGALGAQRDGERGTGGIGGGDGGGHRRSTAAADDDAPRQLRPRRGQTRSDQSTRSRPVPS